MPLLADPPTDDNSAWAHRTLGKALYIACRFETHCRSLAFVLKVREPQLNNKSDEEFWKAVSKAVLGRLVDLNKLIANQTKLREDYEVMLDAARNARNYIAHEAAEKLDQLVKTPAGIDQWRNIMESKLDNIAYGEIIIAVLLSRNAAEPTPTKETINEYPKKIKSWVLQNNA